MVALARSRKRYFPPGLYLITLRRDLLSPLINTTEDWQAFLNCIAIAHGRRSFRLHAAVGFDECILLLLESHEEPLARLVPRIITRYSHRMLSAIDIRGHLFRSGYQAQKLECEEVAAQLRWLHRLPQSRGIKDLDTYEWSTHPLYLHGEKPEWLYTATFDETLRRLNLGTESSSGYRSFIHCDDQRFTELGLAPPPITGVPGVKPPRAPNHGEQTFLRLIDILATQFCFEPEMLRAELRSNDQRRPLPMLRALVARHATDRMFAVPQIEVSAWLGCDDSELSRSLIQQRRENPVLFAVPTVTFLESKRGLRTQTQQ